MFSPLKTLTFAILLCVLNRVSGMAVMGYASKVANPGPEIWLKEYSSFRKNSTAKRTIYNENDFRYRQFFETDLISRENSDYTVLELPLTLTFTCRAPYPVSWTIPDKTQISAINHRRFQEKSKRVSWFAEEDPHPINHLFETQIVIEVSPFLVSVNLTCNSVNKTDMSSSIHLFNTGGYYALENEWKTVLAYLPPTEQVLSEEVTLTLPCRPSNPKSTVTLEKREGDMVFPINETSPGYNLTFDPRVGFTLTFGNNEDDRSSILGLYRCMVEVPRVPEVGGTFIGATGNTSMLVETVVYVNVSSEKLDELKESGEFLRTSVLRENASVHLFQDNFIDPLPTPQTPIVVCCSGIPQHPPKLLYESCQDRLQCQILFQAAERLEQKWDRRRDLLSLETPSQFVSNDTESGCSRADIMYNALVVCKGATMNVAEFYTNVFQESVTPVKKRRNVVRGYPLTPIALTLQKYADIGNVKKSEKALISIGYPTTRQDYLENKNRKYLQFINVSSEDNFEMAYNSKQRPFKNNSMIVGEYPRDFYYEGESMVVVCLGWRWFHAEGARISVLWKNGSRTVVDKVGRENEKEDFIYFSSGVTTRFVDERELTHVFSRTLEANKNMSEVECWLPQVNTERWDKVTKEVEIKDAVPPKFAGKKEVVLNLTLGMESAVEVDCEVVKGAPEPKVKVTKEGHWVIGSYKEDNGGNNGVNVSIAKISAGKNEGGVLAKLRFAKVTREMEGTYQCHAENKEGVDMRTFKVVVN